MSVHHVRQLTIEDQEAYATLRRRALAEAPYAFGSSLEDDHTNRPETVEAMLNGEAPFTVFGALADGALVGILGVGLATKTKRLHRAELFGTFVADEARRAGVGRALMDHALEYARATGVSVVVCEVAHAAAGARALYASYGFEIYGTDAFSLQVDGEMLAADLLVRRL